MEPKDELDTNTTNQTDSVRHQENMTNSSDDNLLNSNIISNGLPIPPMNKLRHITTNNTLQHTISNNDNSDINDYSIYKNIPMYTQSNLFPSYIGEYFNHEQQQQPNCWDRSIMVDNSNFVDENNVLVNNMPMITESSPILSDSNHYPHNGGSNFLPHELIYDSYHTAVGGGGIPNQSQFEYSHNGYYLFNDINQEAWQSSAMTSNNITFNYTTNDRSNIEHIYDQQVSTTKYTTFRGDTNQNTDINNYTFGSQANILSVESDSACFSSDRNKSFINGINNVDQNQISTDVTMHNNIMGQYFNIPDASVVAVGDKTNTMISSTPEVAQSQNYTHKPLLSSTTNKSSRTTDMNGKSLSITPTMPSITNSIMPDNNILCNSINQCVTSQCSLPTLNTTTILSSNDNNSSNITSMDDSVKTIISEKSNVRTLPNSNNTECTLLTDSTDYKNVESIVNKILVPMKYSSYNDIIDLDNQFYKLNLENIDENYYQHTNDTHTNYVNTPTTISDMIIPITNYSITNNIPHSKHTYPLTPTLHSNNTNNNGNSQNNNNVNICNNIVGNNQTLPRNDQFISYQLNNYTNTRKFKVNSTHTHKNVTNSPQVTNTPSSNNNDNDNHNGNNILPINSNPQYMTNMINPNDCYVLPAAHVIGPSMVNNTDLKSNPNLPPLSDKVNKLEAFRNNIASFANMTLKDIQGWIVDFSRDQHGSRFIQQKMEKSTNGVDRDIVFKEIITTDTVLYTLMTDVFGNYVVQKMLEYGNDQQKRVISTHLNDRVLILTTQMYGCRVIQKAIECIPKDIQTDLIHELDGHVLECVKDQNGNHVIQKCIEHVPAINLDFIINEFNGRVFELSSHPYGCRVIQRLMEHCAAAQTHNLMMEIFDNLPSLVKDQYGNYVVQHILDHRKHQDFPTRIINYVFDNIFTLSAHKFASNVVEKCIQFSSISQKEDLIKFILRNSDGGCNDNLYMMMKDPFANYVVQKIVDSVNGEIRKQLLLRMKPYFINLKKLTYGKHMINKVDRWLKETETMTSFIKCEEEFPSLNSAGNLS